MSKETRQAIFQNIMYLTQLGFSIAFPMIFCTLGASWLAEKYQLGSWVIMVGVVVGMLSGVSCFVTFAKQVMKKANRKDDAGGSGH